MAGTATSPGVVADSADLLDFLASEAFAGAAQVEVLEEYRPAVGGSWETFLLTVRVRRGAGDEVRRIVVKRAPDDGPMAPYRADKDAVLLRALEDSDVPHPRLLAWTPDRSVFERPFTVTELVEGELEDLARVDRWPRWRDHGQQLGLELVDTLTRLQAFNWRAAGVASVLSWDGRGGSTRTRMAATVSKWLQTYAAYHDGRAVPAGLEPVVWQEVGSWLEEHVPLLEETELVIVHGDYRFGNLIWQGDRIAAIIDWERATLGDPMSDVGFMCMPFSRLRTPELMFKTLPYDALVSRYEQASGRPVDHRRVQYYAIFWEFIEGAQGAQPPVKLSQTVRTGGTLSAMRKRLVTSSHLLSPNLGVRHALELIDRFERGDHRVVV